MMPAMKNPMDAFKPENLQAMQSSISGLMPQSNKYADLMMEEVERRRNPETAKKDIKRARNDAMMNFGFALMASKNPSFLGGFGEAGIPAAAALKADLKDIKKDARDALIEGAQAEGLKNTAARELASLTLQNANIAATLQSGNLDRDQREKLEKLQRDNAFKIAELGERGANYRLGISEAGANTRAALSAAAEAGKSPYDMGTQKLTYKTVDGEDVERTVNTQVNKQTGEVLHYSNEARGYLKPEYTETLFRRPNALKKFETWAAEQGGVAGVNPQTGELSVRYKNGSIKPANVRWLATQ
jgi:hypothetical protein